MAIPGERGPPTTLALRAARQAFQPSPAPAQLQVAKSAPPASAAVRCRRLHAFAGMLKTQPNRPRQCVCKAKEMLRENARMWRAAMLQTASEVAAPVLVPSLLCRVYPACQSQECSMAADSFYPPAGGAPGCAWRDGVPGWLRRAGEPGCAWRAGDPGGGLTFRLASARRVASCTRSMSGLGIWGYISGVWIKF